MPASWGGSTLCSLGPCQQHPCGTGPQLDPSLSGFMGSWVHLVVLVLATTGEVATKEDKNGKRGQVRKKPQGHLGQTPSLEIPPPRLSLSLTFSLSLSLFLVLEFRTFTLSQSA